MMQSTEIGAHFIRKTGQAVEQLGIVAEYLDIFRFLIYNVVINLAPSFLKQCSALNLHIIHLVLDGIMQRTVDAGGDDINLIAVVDFCIAGSFVCLRPLCDVVVGRIIVKVIEAIVDVLSRIALKSACNIAVEVNPILTVQKEHADADQVGHKFIEVGMIWFSKLFRVFLFLSNHFFHKMLSILCLIAVRMNAFLMS